ncbi:uncharacterized protein RBU33_025065 [Hipposideros larvatus]
MPPTSLPTPSTQWALDKHLLNWIELHYLIAGAEGQVHQSWDFLGLRIDSSQSRQPVSMLFLRHSFRLSAFWFLHNHPVQREASVMTYSMDKITRLDNLKKRKILKKMIIGKSTPRFPLNRLYGIRKEASIIHSGQDMETTEVSFIR